MCSCGCILTVINSIFLTISIAIAIVGGLVAWNSTVITSIVSNTLVSTITTASSGKMSADAATLTSNIISLTKPIGVIIFVLGIIIMALCLLGIVGVCCKSKVCLGLYLAILVAIVVIHIALIITYEVQPTLITSVLDTTIDSWATGYISIVSGDANSVLFASIMMLLNCCGSTSVTDITTSSKFSTSDTYASTAYSSLVRPIPCCKVDSTFTLSDSTCPTVSSSAQQNDNTGCKTLIRAYINTYCNTIVYVSLGILAFFLLLIIIAACTISKF
ncbi:unnamed protein product [Heterobilharzia americana]|nr:unnamed protein product [Heterobilharzia americana]CAH8629152.1 unnamed protein product [Heterobilharzia americana]